MSQATQLCDTLPVPIVRAEQSRAEQSRAEQSRANKDKIENSKCCLNPDFQDLGICGISKFMEGRAKRLALFVLLTVAASQSMEVFV